MIVKKSPAEIDAMATAGDILVRCMDLLAAKIRPGVSAYWGRRVGSANVARRNCVSNAPRTNVDISGGGFAVWRIFNRTAPFVLSGVISAVASTPRPLKATTLSPGFNRRTFSAWCDSASSSRRSSGFHAAGGM